MRFTALKRFVQKRALVERCELCAAPLGPEHSHLVEPSQRKILCACEACALLFDRPTAHEMQAGSLHHNYRRVPRGVNRLYDFRISDEQWARLDIPIDAAFFFRSSPAQRVVALYPGVTGAVESLLALEAWKELVRDNPVLEKLEPDVEALLVNRLKNAREYFRAPIDECYRLAGLIRASWRGFTGGAEVWAAIDTFFDELRTRSRAA